MPTRMRTRPFAPGSHLPPLFLDTRLVSRDMMDLRTQQAGHPPRWGWKQRASHRAPRGRTGGRIKWTRGSTRATSTHEHDQWVPEEGSHGEGGWRRAGAVFRWASVLDWRPASARCGCGRPRRLFEKTIHLMFWSFPYVSRCPL